MIIARNIQSCPQDTDVPADMAHKNDILWQTLCEYYVETVRKKMQQLDQIMKRGKKNKKTKQVDLHVLMFVTVPVCN